MVAHSAAAKSAMIAYTKSVAREWGPHGIRVNALAPGFVPTDNAIAGILADPAAQQRMRDLIPLGDFGTADDIAEVAAFLLGEQSRYVTGAVVTADGGRSLGIGMHDGGGSGKATTITSAARS
jgi:2,4-dienoyl-CoA reductase (NADPH2)